MKSISSNKRALRLIWDKQRWFIPAIVLNNLFGNLAPFFTLYISAFIINELAGARDVARLTMLVAVTVCANLVIVIISSLLRRFEALQEKLLNQQELHMWAEKMLGMDYPNMENAEIQQKRRQVVENTFIDWGGIFALITCIKKLCGQTVNIVLAIALSLGLIGYIVGNYESFAAMYLLIIIAALLVVYIFITKIAAKRYVQMIEVFKERIVEANKVWLGYQYYEMGKDVRLYNMMPIYKDKNKIIYQLFESNFEKLQTMQLMGDLPKTVISQGINFSVYAFVCLNAARGLIPIGNVITYIGYMARLIPAVSEMFGTLLTFSANERLLDLYFEVLDTPNEMYPGSLTVEKRQDNQYEIEFRNVSFKYPGASSYALRNLNMKLHVGQRMAVVGMNGSGKTTMIKLLCRLYDPTEGEITLNGIDIRKYDYAEYLSIFSVVFQDFKLFSFPLGQNVATSVEVDAARAGDCLNKAGMTLRLETMPKGLDTPLYKDFEEDGVEISGGEAQKIALARALYKGAPFIVLDEPTSALDPIAEYEIYSTFNEIVGDKTAIYISHRLSSCRFCDDIAVFHEGSLIQRGSHDTLIADDRGKYHELWYAQAQYYDEKAAS